MTLSVVAYDPLRKLWGVGVATVGPCVGALVPHARKNAGAIATQATTNYYYGPKGLVLLGKGLSARQTVNKLVADDKGRDLRQIHIVDANGESAAFTGKSTLYYANHRTHKNLSVAGNILAGHHVLKQTLKGWYKGHILPFENRLIAALQAGEKAGGDSRGDFISAAIYTVGNNEYGHVDIRVDHHSNPLAECLRILDATKDKSFLTFREMIPNDDNPHNPVAPESTPSKQEPEWLMSAKEAPKP